MQKKVLGILIALVMVLCLLPVGTLAATPVSQIEKSGGTVYYDAAGQPVSQTDAVVEMSKTIEQYRDSNGPVENEFVVTLEVRTQQRLLEISSDTPDAAVLLVMDVSNSMNDCVVCAQENEGGNHGYTIYNACPDSNSTNQTFSPSWERDDGRWVQTDTCQRCGNVRSQHVDVEVQGDHTFQPRLTVTKSSALEFLDQFANRTGAQGNDKRMVAIVAYGTHAVTELDWVDIRTKLGMDAAKAAIDALTIANGGRETSRGDSLQGGGTSIESGLKLGYNVLDAGMDNALKGIDYLYTIMLTDGQPTYGTNGMNNGSTDYIWGNADNTGSSTESRDYDDADDIAASIKGLNNLSKLYSICIGKNSNGNYVWDQTLYGRTTVGEWLESFSTDAFQGDDASTANLFASFNSVLSQIQLATRAWKVEDWMGEHVVYEGEVPVTTKAGARVNNHVTTDLDAADDTGETPEFLWDLLSSNYNPDISTYSESTKSGTLGYTYKYKVRLDNLDKSYTVGSPVEANKPAATLRYAATNSDGTWPSTYQTAEFLTPEVKGLAGELAFEKLDENNQPMAGVTFRLRLDSTLVPEGSQAHFDYLQATTDSKGVVRFSGIPSGHDYILLEENLPDGYLDPGDHDVTIDWGSTTVVKPDGTGLLTDADRDGVAEFYNQKIAKEPGNLTLQKTFAAGSVRPASIRFMVESTDGTYKAQRSLYPSDQVEINGQEVWQWTLHGLNPDLTYTISETDALSATGHHLREDHDLTYSIDVDGVRKVNNAVFVEGNTSTYPEVTVNVGEGATVTVHFNNNMTRKTGTLALEKTFLGLSSVPEDLTMTVTAVEVDSHGQAISGGASATLTFVYDQTTEKYRTARTALPIGYYKLTETVTGNVDNHSHVHYMFTQGAHELANNIVHITENTTASLVLTNHYEEHMGRIRVVKEFTGQNAEDAKAYFANKTIEVYITRFDSMTQKDEIVDTLLLNEDVEWGATSKDLPLGDYKLVENAHTADWPDYVLQASWSPSNVVTVTKDGTAAVRISNDYEKVQNSVNLTIQKDFSGLPAGTQIPNDLKMVVTAIPVDPGNGNEILNEITYELDLTRNADGTYSDTETLPSGTYKLAEQVHGSIGGYVHQGLQFKQNNQVLEQGMITLDGSKNTSVELVLVNTFKEDKRQAELTINKTFIGLEDGTAIPSDLKMTVTATEVDANGVAVSGALPYQLELKNVNGVYTATAMVKAGYYKLTETLEGAIEGYEYQDYLFSQDGLLLVDGIVEAAVDSDVSVTLRNAFEPKPKEDPVVTVSIPFSKTVVQTGTAEPGVNTFYFQADLRFVDTAITVKNSANNTNGIVTNMGNGKFKVMVNGTGKVSGTIEITGKTSELPMILAVYELYSENPGYSEAKAKALEANLATAGWIYDKTASHSVYDLDIWDSYGTMWIASLNVDANGKPAPVIWRNDDIDAKKSEITFTNTYVANLPVAAPPQTGDDSSIAPWLALMGVSAVGMVLVGKRRKTC